MERVTLRRTVALGNFETITAEYTAEGVTLDEARLKASNTILHLLYAEMYRVYQVRQTNTLNQTDYQLLTEIENVKNELQTLNFKKTG